MSQLPIQHCAPRSDLAPDGVRKLLLIGNPNVGKSLLFGCLTHRYVTVSNYPGTTVEITTAKATVAGEQRLVVDTPGTNGLIPQSDDERVARDMLLSSVGADVVQVGDMSNIRRTLLLSLQIAEHEIPFTLCLNMSDEARERDSEVDATALSATLGVPVVATSALRRWNLERLKREAVKPGMAKVAVIYPDAIERGIERVAEVRGLRPEACTRGLALSILAGDETLTPHLPPETLEELDTIRREVQTAVAQPLSVAIANARLAAVDRLLGTAADQQNQRRGNFRDRIGVLSMHPVWGVPFLAFVLYIAWLFVGKFGAGTLVDFVERKVFEQHINVWATTAIDFFRFPHILRDLLVGPYGVITMAITYAIAIVLPVVITFFFFFGVLEDSGYLPRLAIMLNRIFRIMGLNGKAVLPMVLGLGCDTMATLTTRILETKKEATIVTLLLALGVPCSAQLGVIMAMLGPLPLAATAIWIGVTTGTIFLVGWAASKVVPGQSGDFILEIPPIRVPKLSNIAIKVVARTEWYLKEAVPLFIVGTLLLYVLNAAHLLTRLQAVMAPLVVNALGLPAEASNAFLIGFLRRDYGAAGFYAMQKAGHLTPVQTVIALTVITLFVPCIANFLVMLKERGTRMGVFITAFIITYAFGIGAVMHAIFSTFGVRL
ncbi:MAG TPA: ferrous iron transport protein B [Thermoanaerobaculia bacterium]|nr:ferrous iron transport protein B [Thermoanaerobaculia bacterium]